MVVRKKAVENPECIKKIESLLKEVHIDYTQVAPYILAFVHRSIVNERPDFAPEHNERLEFLGDAVLELVVTQNIFLSFPEYDEGKLTDIRSALVRGKNLAQISKNLAFDRYLLLGNGEEMSGGKNNEYILANCLEAFLGAIFIDAGYQEAKKFIDEFIYSTLKNIFENNLLKDYKSLAQEYAQAEFDITPTYKILADFGPDHDKIFEVGIYLKDQLIGTGKGSSKKKAQEVAAEEAFLNKENWKKPL